MAADRLSWLKPSRPSDADYQKSNIRRIIKYSLPIFAILLLAISIYWATKGQGSISVQNLEQDLSGMENTLETARFTSVDEKGRPFVVEADRVIQHNPNDMKAQLEKPKGALTLNESETLTLEANKGDYDHKARSLDLEGDVIIQKNDDITFTTQQLNVNVETQKAHNNVPVKATTIEGHSLDAQAIDMSTDARRVIFKGPARLTVNRETGETE